LAAFCRGRAVGGGGVPQCQQQLIPKTPKTGQDIREINDADLMGRDIPAIGFQQLKVMTREMNGLDVQRIRQSGYLFVEGLHQAGNGKAYFKGQGWIGLRELFFDGGPGVQVQTFGKGLLLYAELLVSGMEHLLFEGCRGGGIYDLLPGKFNEGCRHRGKFRLTIDIQVAAWSGALLIRLHPL